MAGLIPVAEWAREVARADKMLCLLPSLGRGAEPQVIRIAVTGLREATCLAGCQGRLHDLNRSCTVIPVTIVSGLRPLTGDAKEIADNCIDLRAGSCRRGAKSFVFHMRRTAGAAV